MSSLPTLLVCSVSQDSQLVCSSRDPSLFFLASSCLISGFFLAYLCLISDHSEYFWLVSGFYLACLSSCASLYSFPATCLPSTLIGSVARRRRVVLQTVQTAPPSREVIQKERGRTQLLSAALDVISCLIHSTL